MSPVPTQRSILVDDDEAATPSAWVLIGTIYVAKLSTIVLVVWAAHNYQATALVAATTWPWLALTAALGTGPLLFHRRVRCVRAKLAQLRRAEWFITPPSEPTFPTPIR